MYEIISNWPWYDRLFFGFFLFAILSVPWLIVDVSKKLERIIRLLEIQVDK